MTAVTHLVPDRLFDGDAVRAGLAVSIADGVIRGVVPVDRLPPDAVIRELPGATLCPGLIDAHVHLAPWMVYGLLAAGVTRVRDCGNDVDTVVALLREVDDVPHPAVHWSGPLMESDRVNWPSIAKAHASPDEIRATVAASAARGWRSVKLYANAGPELVAAAAGEARAHGQRVLCHLGATRFAEAAAIGVDELQHLAGCVPADLGGDPDAALTAIVEADIDHCPTFVVWQALAMLGEPRRRRDAADRWVPPATRAAWAGAYHATQPAAERLERLRLLLDRMALVPRLLQAGRRIVVGSDAPFPGLVPGWSLHDEASMLVTAGMTPLETMRALTVGNAAVLGVPDAGVVRPGAVADLAAFRGDPTETIADLTEVVGVWRAGEAVDLDALPGRAAAAFGRLSPSPVDRIGERRYVPATADG